MMQIKNLKKSYGKKQAIKDLSLQAENGVYGILGPNGAGKTTLMKCIVGLENYEGKIVYEKEKGIGYLPQKFSLFRQLKVGEAMEYITALKKAEVKDIDGILGKVNLLEEKNTKIKNLSGGMLRRLGIAQALVGNPAVLVVDEPTVGLDPKERIRFRNLLAELEEERTILITSHIVEDMDAIADYILLMKEGEIVASGTKAQLIQQMTGKVVECEVDRSEIKQYEKYNYTSIMHTGEKSIMRFVGDDLQDGTLRTATLEDVYFYYVGEEDE